MFRRPNKPTDPDQVTYSQCADALYACRRKLGLGVYRKVVKLIEAAIDNKPGTWIREYREDGKKKWYRCSKCHHHVVVPFRHCPECGNSKVDAAGDIRKDDRTV